MTQYELEVLMKIIMGLVALALYGLVCYVFGKSKAEIFPDDVDIDNIEEALNEAHLQGYEEGYEAGYVKALQHIIKSHIKERNFDYEEI